MARPHGISSSVPELSDFLNRWNAIIFDCDGVMQVVLCTSCTSLRSQLPTHLFSWQGNTLYSNIREAFQVIQERRIPHFFCSNNATASRSHYLEKFHALGLTHVTKSQIYTSGYAAARYLKSTLLHQFPPDKRGIYLIGQRGLEHELEEAGLRWSGGTDPQDNVFMPDQDFSSIGPDPSISIVLQGFDMHINYKKYCKAYNYLVQNKGSKLVLTNADRDVFTDNAICPGEGALAAVLLPCVDEPIIVGKPERILLDIIVSEHNLDHSTTLMVGDRPATDILFAKNGGLASLLVLTGSASESDLDQLSAEEMPDYYISGFGEFARLLS